MNATFYGSDTEDTKTKESTSSDAGDILDFGVSVEVTDDNRREIAKETNEIRAVNKAIKKDLKTELEFEVRLKKDLGYTWTEMSELAESMYNENAKAITHRAFLTGFKNKHESKIVLHVQKTDPQSNIGDIYDDNGHLSQPHPVTPDSRGVKNDQELGQDCIYGHMYKQRKKSVVAMRQKLERNVEELEKIWKDIEHVQGQKESILFRMEEHDLEGALERCEVIL
ncbi:MAG: hypothetical protein SGARI_004951, partial [Bacillariaceae sp.]